MHAYESLIGVWAPHSRQARPTAGPKSWATPGAAPPASSDAVMIEPFLIFPTSRDVGPELAPAPKRHPRIWCRPGGCRGFVGPFPLPLWMSGVKLLLNKGI